MIFDRWNASLPTRFWTAVNAGDYARYDPDRFDARRASHLFPVIDWLDRGPIPDFVRKNFGPKADVVLEQYPWPGEEPAAVAYQVAAIGTDSGNLGTGVIEQGIGDARIG